MTAKTTEKDTLEELPVVYIDDMLMSLKYFVDEHYAHIQIIDPQVCLACVEKSCLYFCPVGAYRQSSDGQVQVASQSCIECGSCRVGCPPANVRWTLPRGGYGIAYRFG